MAPVMGLTGACVPGPHGNNTGAGERRQRTALWLTTGKRRGLQSSRTYARTISRGASSWLE